MRTFLRSGLVALLVAVPARGADPDAAGVEFFEKKIRPVLVERCYSCHSAEAAREKKLRGGLLLDTREGVRKGGDTGPAVMPGKPDEGTLLKALRQTGDLKMPPKGKLTDVVLADFEKWIALGAPDPRDSAVTTATAPVIDWEQARKHWAFQPPVKHALPEVKRTDWSRSWIDRFVLAELEKRGLQPVPAAGKRELIRRATFDLLGLPPTPDEVDTFLKDDSPEAFARVVDRLLASPHYGERWGRYWLDVARYAEDKALAFPTPRPHAHQYRDWVVRAFNEDMPYDRFLRLQLAGDLVPEPFSDYTLKLAGLGFQGLGAEYHKGSVPAQVMADELDDRIDTLTRGLLGLTVACARCHDHKYDPIPTRDYYSLAAAYNGAAWTEVFLGPPKVVETYQAWERKNRQIEGEIAQFLADQGKALGKGVLADLSLLPSPERQRYDSLQAALANHKRELLPVPPKAHGVSGGGQAMRVYQRGNVEKPGEPAPPGFLRILDTGARRPESSAFTRLQLAEAVCSPQNPLTARVFVNRVWHHLFGRGIVGTPSNFGKLGEPPTHPELLDTLAVRFVEAGWSVKWLHREILLSAAYQLGSGHGPADTVDPENRYLWRHTPRRLDVEAWRDAVLLVSGRLDRTLGGPSSSLGDAGHSRRTLYGKVSRLEPDRMLVLFDFPDANVSSERRSITTVPQQQLFALNSDFMVASARALAARLTSAAPGDEERIVLAYRWAFARSPSPRERQAALAFLREAPTGAGNRLTALEQFAQAILACNEFAWVD
jgi:hypothetical protein